MAEESFSPAQSLQLIQAMINKVKQDITDNTVYFLVWGWITFVACTAQFVLKRIMDYEQHYQVWWLIIVGVIFSIWKGAKEGKKKKARTYVGDSMKNLWIGMGISFFVLSVILSKIGWGSPIFPFFILLYGLGTFLSGTIIHFKPLIFGGIIAWILAIGSVFVEYDFQILFGAGAILFSYIIPAYMLRSKNKRIHQ